MRDRAGTSGRRLPLVGRDVQDPVLQATFRHVLITSPRPAAALYRTLAHRPVLLRAWIDFAWTLREQGCVDRAIRELAILRVAQLTNVDYEWSHHLPMARSAGVPADKIAGLESWPASPVFSDYERAVLQAVDELTESGHVSDPTWTGLARHTDPGALVEIILTIAFYSCVSRTIHAFEIAPSDDQLDGGLAG